MQTYQLPSLNFGRLMFAKRVALSGGRALAVVAAFLLAAPQVHAQSSTWYWDSNGSTAGAGSQPNGVWDNVGYNAQWDSSSAGTGTVNPYTTLSTDNLYFVAGPSATSGNGAYYVNVYGEEQANSLNFQSSGAATLTSDFNDSTTGGQIDLYGGGINVAQYAYGTTATGSVTLGYATGNGGTAYALTLNLEANQTWTNNSANGLTVNGSVTGTGSLTLAANSTGSITISSNPINIAGTITNSGTGATTTTITGGVGSSVTGLIENSATSAFSITNTLTVNGTATTLTNNNTSGSQVLTVSGPIVGTGNLIIANNSSIANGITITTATITNAGTITNSGTGTGSVTISSVIGSSVTGVTQNSATSALALTGTNTFAGGTTVTLGTLYFSNGNSSATAAQQLGENATLTLNAASGTTADLNYNGSGTATLAKNITASGSGTDIIQNSGSGSLTLSGTVSGTPAFYAGSQGITLSGPVTASSLTDYTGTLSVSSQITAGTGLAIQGPGAVSLTYTTAANTPGTITVGQNATSGSLGGTLITNTQNNLGSGAVNVNYGGILDFGTVNTNVAASNNITVNAGGLAFFNANGGSSTTNITPTGLLSVGNLGSVAWTQQVYGANTVFNYTAGTTISLPNAGEVSFDGGFMDNNPAVIDISGAYASGGLAGTLAIDGGNFLSLIGSSTSPNHIVFTSASTLSTTAGSARTLALNLQGDGASSRSAIPLYLGGINLNAALTVAGTGNGGLMSAVAPIGYNELGALTSSTGTYYALTVAMSPEGAVGVPYTGNTGVSSVTVNSGWLAVDEQSNPSGTHYVFSNSSAGIMLNGGGLAITPYSGTIQDAIVIGANGGSIDAEATAGQNGASAGVNNFSGNSNSYATLSGNISGSGSLTLISGAQTHGNVGNNFGGWIALSGNNSGYTGTITLAATGAFSGVQFMGANSAINAASIIAPYGTAFGFDTSNNLSSTISTATTLLPKFNFSGATINGQNDAVFAPLYSWYSTSTATINLSNSGANALNFSGQLGLDIGQYQGGSVTVSATIIPYSSTVGYRFTATGNSTSMNFSTANVLTGTYPVDFSDIAVAPGQYDRIATDPINITASQNFTGAFSVNGVGPAAIAYTSAMQLDNPFEQTGGNGSNGYQVGATVNIGTGGNLTGVTSITLDELGQLTLNGTSGQISSAGSGGSLPVTIEGGSILQIGDTTAANNNGVTNRLNSDAAITLGGANGGGQLNIGYATASNTTSQAFASLAIGTGASAIDVFNTAAGTLGITVSSGTITRSGPGATLYLPYPTSGDFAGITLTGATATTGGAAINGWMFIPTNSGNVTGATYATVNASHQLVAYTDGTNTIASGNDWVNTSAGTVSSNVTLNTVNFNTSSNNLNINSGDTLTLTTGGILVNKTGLNLGNYGGSLTSATNELIVNNAFNPGQGDTFTISAPIVQYGGSNINLTKLGGTQPTTSYPGAADLYSALNLSSGSNALGNIWISGGQVEVSTAVGSLGTGSTSSNTVTLEGGGLFLNLSGTSASPNTFNQQIVTEPRGTYSTNQGQVELNGISSGNAGEFTTFTGNVTLDGALQVSPYGGGDTVQFSGNISGYAPIMVGYSQSNNVQNVVLSGNNSSFTGGIGIYASDRVRLESTTAAGSGQIVSLDAQGAGGNSGGQTTNPSLYLGTGASGITLANNVINLQGLVDWNTGSSISSDSGTKETYTGNIDTLEGLVLQGNSTSTSAVSETVLNGSVSVGGLPLYFYNYSTTPTTSIQNFVNGQGGITLGVTDYIGNTALTDTSTLGAFAVDAPTAGTYFNKGAQGFVTFAGANSFIPGAVGDGYLAALAVAGAGTTDQFGFLLSGTSSNGGSTYQLPQGKSFLIGSLGSGTQVSGILGATSGTATLLGSAKAAAGQTLTGFPGGDIDIEANSATSTQSLELLARASTDNLTLGTSTNTVVFSPTYGDSGDSSAITILGERTGATALNLIGAGTVQFSNVAFTNTDGSDASSNFAINVEGGTLEATGTFKPAVALYSGTNLTGTGSITTVTLAGSDTVSSTGTLTTNSISVSGSGNTISSGTVGGAVTINSGGALALAGTAGGAVTVNGTLTGTGTVNGLLTTSSTGVVDPGTAGTVGTLHVGSLGFTIGSGTTFNYDINTGTTAGGTTNDLISMNGGTLSIGGTGIKFNFNQLSSLTTGTAYTLVSGASSVTGFSASDFTATGVGTDLATFSLSGNNLDVTFALPYTTGTYTLATTAGGTSSARILVSTSGESTGTSTALSTVLKNTGSSSSTPPADSINVTGLGATSTPTTTAGVTGSTVGSSTTVADSGSLTNSSQIFASATTGTYTISPTVSTATGANASGVATDAGNTSASVVVVNERSFTSTGTLALGRFLINTAPTGTVTVASSGLNGTTATATLTTFTGSGTDSLSLGTGNSLTYNGSSSTQTDTFTLSGTAGATTGTVSGSFSSTPTDEFGNTLSNVTVALTGDAVAKRTFSSTSTATPVNLGIYHTGAAVSGSTSYSSTGTYTTTTSVEVAAGSTAGSVNGVTISSADTSFTGTTSSAVVVPVTFGGNIVNGSGGTTTGTLSLAARTLETGLGDTYANVGVAYSAYVYTGAGVWNNAGGGAWGTTQTSNQTLTNWLITGGTPGISGAPFLTTDSASFGNTGFSGTATVTLGAASPYLNAITFNNSAGSYDIEQGGTGTINLDSSTGMATITDSAGNHTIGAPINLVSNGETAVAANSTLTINGTITDPGEGMTITGPGTTVLTAANTYTNGTTVASGTLLVANGTNGSATGTGSVTLAAGATLGGAGQIQASAFNLGAASPAAAANVIVGNGTDSTSTLTLTGSTSSSVPNTITNVSLAFNISATTLGQSNVLNVGNSDITFSNTTLSLNVQGLAWIAAYTPYILIQGTGTNQYLGLTTTSTVIDGQTYAVITDPSALQLSFSQSYANNVYGPHSVLFLNTANGADDIEVLVVPEPGTWALMFGGLAMLIFWQRTRRKY